ncbi:MAG: hypothetical protein IJH51_05340 [Christensenellaceae bacterium]|nr:hypothetical protein [Christensenellaceae bacterium]
METIIQFIGLIVIAAFALYILSGAKQGFICSCANTLSVAVSWLISAALSPMLASGLQGSSFHTLVTYMSEVTDSVSSIQLAKTPVSQLTAAQFAQLPEYANLPEIYTDRFIENVTNQSLAGTGAETVSQYLNMTIANVTMGIICFVIVYLVARALFMIIISTANYTSPFRVLKHYDSIAGGVMGAIRAYMILHVVAMFTPVLLTFVMGTELSKLISGSEVINYFYMNNSLFEFIRGVIP